MILTSRRLYKKVEMTEPGSKNKYRITYQDGQQKWTNDRPGDKEPGKEKARKKERRQKIPSRVEERSRLDGVLSDFIGGGKTEKDLESEVDQTIINLGREAAREVLRDWAEGKDGKDEKTTKALGIMRKRLTEKSSRQRRMANRIVACWFLQKLK